ncbi:MAG: dTDP-4-dehydrorhamnose reductase [Candidatus Marinimicrobia bacterium]|nr:dTDP-4-dehydrorhamnose reductase [Candidatus Neomarinimicrobiota bacterium]
MKKILVTGAFGQLGTSLCEVLSNKSILATGRIITTTEKYRSVELDITNQKNVEELIHNYKPDIIIHLAAMTDVDGCEKDPEIAFDINVRATENLLKNFRGKFIYISTDYVFDGEEGPYSEDDKVNPVSVYGKTKLYGESLIKESDIDWVILRSNIIFSYNDRTKASFVNWVVDSLKRKQIITVVNDQWNNPTWTNDLANVISMIIKKNISGLYHYGGGDFLNRLEFAKMIASAFSLDRGLIQPITTPELNWLAQRPLKSGLYTNKIELDLGIEPFPIQKALDKMVSLL